MKLFTSKKVKESPEATKARVMANYARLQETVRNSRTIEDIIFNTK